MLTYKTCSKAFNVIEQRNCFNEGTFIEFLLRSINISNWLHVHKNYRWNFHIKGLFTIRLHGYMCNDGSIQLEVN